MSTSNTPIKSLRRLKGEFKKNGLRYRLEKRTDKVAMYHVLASYSDKVNHIEVFRVFIKPPDKYIKSHYEYFPSNEDFGRLYDSKAFCGVKKFKKAEEHYKHLVKMTTSNTRPPNSGPSQNQNAA